MIYEHMHTMIVSTTIYMHNFSVYMYTVTLTFVAISFVIWITYTKLCDVCLFELNLPCCRHCYWCFLLAWNKIVKLELWSTSVCIYIWLKKTTTKNKSVTILMNLKVLQSATNIGNLSSALEELNANPVGILFIPWDISRHNTNKRI